MSRFQFVDDAKADYPVRRLCEVLTINRSSFYKWKDTTAQRQTRLVNDAVLAARITAVFDANNGCYGAKRITAESAAEAYVSDVTYRPIADGSNMYLATVIDCFSRRLIGFAIAGHTRMSLVQEALVIAENQRGSLSGETSHSDRGSVYTSGVFQDTCRRLGACQSMGSIGTQRGQRVS